MYVRDFERIAMNQPRVFDLHCDTLDRIAFAGTSTYDDSTKEDFPSLAHNAGHISLEHIGTVPWVQCFAVFIPDSHRWQDAVSFFEKVYNCFLKQLELFPHALEQIKDARRIDQALADGKTAALLTVEGGSVLNGQISRVQTVDEMGVKMITLTWNGKNGIGSGHDTTDGLTTFGREAIRALEDHRIVVDVSHLNDPGFNDLLDIVHRPFAASHSNSRTVCPHPRNLTDRQFQAICASGGLVGLNFHKDFLVSDKPAATFDDLSYHVDKFLELGGENHLALGSDYDGADIPAWLAPCHKMVDLHALMSARFGAELTDKIFFTNAHEFFVRNETA